MRSDEVVGRELVRIVFERWMLFMVWEEVLGRSASMLGRLVVSLLDKPAALVFGAELSKLFPSMNGSYFFSVFSFSFNSFCFMEYDRPNKPVGAKGLSPLELLMLPEFSSAEEELERTFDIPDEIGGYLDLWDDLGGIPLL